MFYSSSLHIVVSMCNHAYYRERKKSISILRATRTRTRTFALRVWKKALISSERNEWTLDEKKFQANKDWTIFHYIKALNVWCISIWRLCMFVFVNCVYLYGTVHCINSINASVCVLFACVVNTHVKESNVCKKFFPFFFTSSSLRSTKLLLLLLPVFFYILKPDVAGSQ